MYNFSIGVMLDSFKLDTKEAIERPLPWGKRIANVQPRDYAPKT